MVVVFELVHVQSCDCPPCCTHSWQLVRCSSGFVPDEHSSVKACRVDVVCPHPLPSSSITRKRLCIELLVVVFWHGLVVCSGFRVVQRNVSSPTCLPSCHQPRNDSESAYRVSRLGFALRRVQGLSLAHTDGRHRLAPVDHATCCPCRWCTARRLHCLWTTSRAA